MRMGYEAGNSISAGNVRQFPAGVQGSVHAEHDFETTIHLAVAAGLEQCGADDREAVIGVFVGAVATPEAFYEVQQVAGVKRLVYSHVVCAAGV